MAARVVVGVGLACVALCFLAACVQVQMRRYLLVAVCTCGGICTAGRERARIAACLALLSPCPSPRAMTHRCPPPQRPEIAELKQKQLGSPAEQLPKGKVFNGWLKAAAPDGGGDAGRAAGNDQSDGEDDTAVYSDEGGVKWWEREHLAPPPAGWHRPVSHKKATKKHQKKAVFDPPGVGANANPAQIEEELKKNPNLFGSGRPESYVAQHLHRQHRTISALLMDPKVHTRHKAVDLPDRA